MVRPEGSCCFGVTAEAPFDVSFRASVASRGISLAVAKSGLDMEIPRLPSALLRAGCLEWRWLSSSTILDKVVTFWDSFIQGEGELLAQRKPRSSLLTHGMNSKRPAQRLSL